jgi:hypothetical protein
MSSRRNRRTNKKCIKKNIDEPNNEQEETIEEIHIEQDIELKKREYYFDTFLSCSYDIAVYIFSFTYKTIKFIFKISGIYLLWICLHFVASHLYIKLCVPSTIIGFIMSPFMTATPHCLGLRWIVYNAANMINNMWIILGTWICSTILIINNRGPETPSP